MKQEEAQLIDKHLTSMIEHANDVLYIANNSGDEGLRQAVRNSLGNAVASIHFEIWELVYSQYPNLRPPEMTADEQGGGPQESSPDLA